MPVAFSECKDYDADRASAGASVGATTELVYIHPYSPGQIACNALAVRTRAVAVKLFRVNGHWVEIRRIPSPTLPTAPQTK